MTPVEYVLLDPSGNRTALVTSWGGPEEEGEITRRLLEKSEQVAYLEEASLPGAAARVRLMGGDFCGNAAMAAAGWLIRDEIREDRETAVPLEVSGAEGIVLCRVRGRAECFEGTVSLPPPLEIREMALDGEKLTLVRMQGIVHLIRESGRPLEKERAEALLRHLAETLPDDAAGLMDRNPETGMMRPLVYVRGSGSMVWETACGSGSAAVGALEASRRGGGETLTRVIQPGGTIRVTAFAENGRVTDVSITGIVKIVEEE